MSRQIVTIDSVSQIHESLGLASPKHPLITLLPIDKRLTDFDYGDNTYVLDLFQISLKSGISGSIVYGRNQYDFQEGSMVFSKPGQAMSFFNPEVTGTTQGWTLLFHPDLIRRSSLAQHLESYSFFSYEMHEALHLSDSEKTNLFELAQKIESEYNQGIDRHSQKLIVSTIELMLDYCLRYYDRQFYTRSNLNQDKTTVFFEFLQSYYRDNQQESNGLPSVKACSEHLQMSASYLSDMLKKESGRNAQQLIQEFVIDRAKNELLASNKQITQIAYDLGFEYPQHFSKLFKSKTGMSPNKFRTLQ